MGTKLRRFPGNMRVSSYKDVRNEIRSGDILLCSGDAVFSNMIKKATESDWSHVAFVMWLPSIDRLMVMESVESVGVRTIPLSRYLSGYKEEGKPYPGRLLIARHGKFESVSQQRMEKMGQFAADHLSYPYDRDEIARIAARIVQSKLGLRGKDVKRDKEYICSEFVWECYKAVGIKVAYGDMGFIAPADFAVADGVEPVFRLN